jgi:hypothetical protein
MRWFCMTGGSWCSAARHRLWRGADEMQVGAADRAGREAHDRVGGILDHRIRDLIDRHLTQVMPQGLHAMLLRVNCPVAAPWLASLPVMRRGAKSARAVMNA